MTQRTRSNPRARGMMLTEACVGLALVGVLLGAVSLMLSRQARATDYFLNYRRAELAAQSCVERMRAGLVPVADGTWTDNAGISYDIRTSTADPAWQPLTRVEVTARVVGKYGRVAHYRLTAYVAPSQPTGVGKP